MASMIDRIPSLDDAGLAALGANAERLAREGTEAQKTEAAELLPEIRGEMARRSAAKLTAMREKRAAVQAERPAKAKPAAKPRAAAVTKPRKRKVTAPAE